MISEFVKKLREKADLFEKSKFAVGGLVNDYREAADLIEALEIHIQHIQQNNHCTCESKEYIELVDHPEHYRGKYECIDEMISLFGIEDVKAFCRCNVYKYRYRADRKNGQEDIMKAEWYMEKLMELEGME